MKTYTHNPALFRAHYRAQIGSGLPGFRGRQYGEGLLGDAARRAIPLLRPLLKQAMKKAAPHVRQIAPKVLDYAQDIAKEKFMAKMPRLAAKVFKPKKRKHSGVISSQKRQRTTSQDVFN